MVTRRARTIAWVLAGGLIVGCGDGAAPPRRMPPRTWVCPGGWVAAGNGGCGPAVLLCAPEGGAAAGACDHVDLVHTSSISLPDGGAVEGFRRLPDGGIGGGWPESDEDEHSPSAGVAACLDGWRRNVDGTCDPALRGDCPAGGAALPGGACTLTSESDCPAGEYADPGPEAAGARVVHVRASADEATGDGSVAHPYADIEDSIVRAGPGGWVLLARGVYLHRPLATHTRVHVIGVCAAGVIIDGRTTTSTDGALPTFNVRGADTDVTLRNVTIRSVGYGIQVISGARLRASGVVVENSGGVGVFVSDPGTRAEVALSVVRGTRTRRPFSSGDGVFVGQGASAAVSGVAFEGNTGVALRFRDAGTTGEVEGCVARGTRPDDRGTYGVGLLAHDGARVRASGLVVDDSRQAGVGAAGAGTEVTLTDVVVRGTRASPHGGGSGIEVNGGATLRATNALVDDNTRVGVLATEPGTSVELRASVVRGTRPFAGESSGGGLQANQGASLRASGVVISRNTSVGAVAIAPGTLLELTSSVVRDTRVDLMLRFGHGLLAREGATLRATGVAIDANASSGVLLGGVGTVAELVGSAIRRTHAASSGVYGRALDVEQGAVVRVFGALLADSVEMAAWANGAGARIEARDLLIVGVRPAIGGFGVGIFAHAGARIDGVRVAAQSVAGAGVVALPFAGATSRVTLEDLFVRDVRSSTVQVSEQGGVGYPSGPAVSYGLHAGPGSVIEASRAVIDTGGFGIFNASGVLRLRVGLIVRQREALGAFDLATPAEATTLDGVASGENVTDALVRRNDLPTASSLAAPADPCADGC